MTDEELRTLRQSLLRQRDEGYALYLKAVGALDLLDYIEAQAESDEQEDPIPERVSRPIDE